MLIYSSKKETQNHILKKKRKTTYWWHWEDNFNCCMVGPQGLHFCKSDFGHLWPTAQNWDILGPTVQQLKLSSNVTNMWFCVSFFECGFAFLFLKSIYCIHTTFSFAVQYIYSPYQNCQLIPIGNPVGMNWIELLLSWRELVYIGILNFQLE